MEGINKRERVYDLEERTAKFGEAVIVFVKKMPTNKMTERIISQLIGAATSVGANYCETDCAESKKDFEHKMGIANKEAKESKHFLRMAVAVCPELVLEGRLLWKEAKELNLIFTSIIKKSRENKSENHIDGSG